MYLHRATVTVLVATCLWFNASGVYAASACFLQKKLTASDVDDDDRFGRSVSLSGDTALIGAWSDDCAAGSSCGAAYVYRFDGNNWLEVQKLTASDAEAGDLFGVSVALSGDVAIVGAHYKDCAAGADCGAAYVYRFDGIEWVEEEKLTASDAGGSDFFGASVSVSGDSAVVGASHDACAAGIRCGAAYVFTFNGAGWEEQKLTAPDADTYDQFGASVSASQDWISVGAHQHICSGGGFCGSVYMFRPTLAGWVVGQKLSAFEPEPGGYFGRSVSVSGATLAVGADSRSCAAGSLCGAAYVFRWTGVEWAGEQKFTAIEPSAFDQFGSAVSVNGDILAVGAKLDDCTGSSNCGAVYVYEFTGTTWVGGRRLIAADAFYDDFLGFSVSVDGGLVLAGAYGDDNVGTCRSDCGSARVFTLEPGPADFDCDDDVDLFNFATLQVLFTGELSGYAAFHAVFSGPR